MTNVLLLDDVDDLRDTLEQYLSLDGCDVVSCRAPGEALAALDGEDFDCLVLDRQLDGVDGIGVIEEVQATHPGLPIILMSGAGPGPCRGVVFLAKPFRMRELGSCVRALVAS